MDDEKIISEILDRIDHNFINVDDIHEMYNLSDSYVYGNIEVPRVTAVIGSYNTDTTYLCNWANSLGFKRQSYSNYMKKASGLGTAIHNIVEEYIKTGAEPIFNSFVTDDSKEILENAYYGFKMFWDTFKNTHSIEDYKLEWKIISPYYGGTLDLWIKEKNGTETIYDFKSCNHIKFKHFIQLAAYKYSVEHYLDEPHHIQKVGILKITKDQPLVVEHLIDTAIDVNKLYIEHCTQCFISMLYTYFNTMRVEKDFKQIIMRKV